ncbi:MAG: helix-turn-helix domain-containing protein [Pseudomonadota bacterium]
MDKKEFDRILTAVGAVFDLDRRVMLSRLREDRVIQGRHLAMFLVRYRMLLKYAAIAGLFNRFDHGTVHHACHAVVARYKQDPSYLQKVQRVIEQLEPVSLEERKILELEGITV